MESTVTFRTATLQDAPQLLSIYAPYVTDSAITFEWEVPSEEEFRARIAHTLNRYPYLVAERSGRVLGYAYAGTFKERAAYDWCVETSIYLYHDARHQGIGGRLYAALEECLHTMGIINLNACISYPKAIDAHLTTNSVQFHEHLGYRLVGTFHDCGYKFGTWYDMVWMEKMLCPHPANPTRVRDFADVLPQLVSEGTLAS